MRVSLTATNIAAIRRQIGALQEVDRVIDYDVRAWTDELVQRDLAGTQNYAPEIAPGVWRANTTRAQRAAFFAKLRDGGWHGRTGELGRAWRVEALGPARYKIRNDQPYAGWIVGNAIGLQQTRWARLYWWRYRDRVNARIPDLQRRIDVAIEHNWQQGI